MNYAKIGDDWVIVTFRWRDQIFALTDMGRLYRAEVYPSDKITTWQLVTRIDQY